MLSQHACGKHVWCIHDPSYAGSFGLIIDLHCMNREGLAELYSIFWGLPKRSWSSQVSLLGTEASLYTPYCSSIGA